MSAKNSPLCISILDSTSQASQQSDLVIENAPDNKNPPHYQQRFEETKELFQNDNNKLNFDDFISFQSSPDQNSNKSKLTFNEFLGILRSSKQLQKTSPSIKQCTFDKTDQGRIRRILRNQSKLLNYMQEKAKPNNCLHEYCSQCILAWTKLSNLCPLCKIEITELQLIDNEGKIQEIIKVQKRLDAFEELHDLAIQFADFCYECSQADNEQLLLVCDSCNYNVCHTYCCNLDSIPEDNWYCKNCIEEEEARERLLKEKRRKNKLRRKRNKQQYLQNNSTIFNNQTWPKRINTLNFNTNNNQKSNEDEQEDITLLLQQNNELYNQSDEDESSSIHKLNRNRKNKSCNNRSLLGKRINGISSTSDKFLNLDFQRNDKFYQDGQRNYLDSEHHQENDNVISNNIFESSGINQVIDLGNKVDDFKSQDGKNNLLPENYRGNSPLNDSKNSLSQSVIEITEQELILDQNLNFGVQNVKISKSSLSECIKKLKRRQDTSNQSSLNILENSQQSERYRNFFNKKKNITENHHLSTSNLQLRYNFGTKTSNQQQ
ncbi:phd-finger family expressed [Stylonychia lemnae]|uniref:Phd-finger family expressed n=1 Tax=Stylonychia lemnae TaxID=5949 RepID=A0A077ZUI1_STYLE|nr:phd-finger family expressed [Stylonychia lemnae]|eukprot:CDW73563.1 phd-finger family expressed [Stylonychia lemnae]